MSENEVETTGMEATAEKQTTAQVAERPKRAKESTANKESPAKAKEKRATVDEMMATIKNMTVLELSELVKAMEVEFGVSAATPVAAAPAAAAPAEAPPAEEQTEFSVILKEVGPNKISVIKTVRELTSLGLKEAKDLVESAPAAVREAITKDEVANVKRRLEEAGASVEIK